MNQKHATLIGLLAILLWSSTVGLIRAVADSFGAVGGAALIYTAASFFLLVSVGPTRIRQFPRRYLIWGTLLFVLYELCLSLSIGFANNSQQAIEVGMVNYLWPSFTILAAILFNGQRANILIVPGFVLAMLGICWVLGGEAGFDLSSIWLNIQDNPLSYGLALLGAVLWALYCAITVRIAEGQNGITLFFMMVALVLWLRFFMSDTQPLEFNLQSTSYLLLAASAMGFGYAAWNIGIIHGQVTLLAGFSYFIPVFSAALAAFILGSALTLHFWLGALMVCAGSILCWLATQRPKQLKPNS